MLVRRCLMGAIVGMSGGFIVGLIGGFVFGPIGMMLSEEETGTTVNVLGVALLLSIPIGTIIGIMVPIREHSKRRQAAKEEEEARLRR